MMNLWHEHTQFTPLRAGPSVLPQLYPAIQLLSRLDDHSVLLSTQHSVLELLDEHSLAQLAHLSG